MSTARERREKRRQQEQIAQNRPRESRQVTAPGQRPNPSFRLPFNRWFLVVPAAVALVVGVILVLGSLNPPEARRSPNAIWLDRQFSYSAPSDSELNQLIAQWRQHQIATIYLFTASLKPDNQWSGVPEQTNRFIEAEPLVASIVERIHAGYPDARVMAWIEVLADTPEYRLNTAQVRASITDFAARMINGLRFDGVMLDIKPIFDGNPDLPVILREVRGAIGLDTFIAVAVPADLTPSDAGIALPTFIAPDTVWTPAYKQRISLQADQLVVTAYNSYLTDQVDYINWVAYQVGAFASALGDSPAELLISVPNYTAPAGITPVAHDPVVESMAGALDGVTRGLRALPAADFARFTGVAIYTDRILAENDWRIFTDKWLNAALRPAED
jgi:hypothetical protein